MFMDIFLWGALRAPVTYFLFRIDTPSPSSHT